MAKGEATDKEGHPWHAVTCAATTTKIQWKSASRGSLARTIASSARSMRWLRPASTAAVGSSAIAWTRRERSSALPTARRRLAPTRFTHEAGDRRGGDRMLKLEVKTRLPEEQVKQRIKAFFKDGWGLNITAEASDCVTFEGGGGYVTAAVCREANETRVELETREWEEQIKQFARDVT